MSKKSIIEMFMVDLIKMDLYRKIQEKRQEQIIQ